MRWVTISLSSFPDTPIRLTLTPGVAIYGIRASLCIRNLCLSQQIQQERAPQFARLLRTNEQRTCGGILKSVVMTLELKKMSPSTEPSPHLSPRTMPLPIPVPSVQSSTASPSDAMEEHVRPQPGQMYAYARDTALLVGKVCASMPVGLYETTTTEPNLCVQDRSNFRNCLCFLIITSSQNFLGDVQIGMLGQIHIIYKVRQLP